jgi:hypothetical protein
MNLTLTDVLIYEIGYLYNGTRRMSQNSHNMNVFDRLAKKLQRDRTAKNEDYHQFNYIKDEVFKVKKIVWPCYEIK